MKKKIDKKKLNEHINLWMPLLLAIPLMIVEMIAMFGGLEVPIGYSWYVFAAAGITIFYFGRQYYLWSFHEIFKLKRIGMSTLITISTWVAFFYSTYLLIDQTITLVNTGINPHIMTFFEVGATIIAIVNLGEFISAYIKSKSQKDIDQIFKLQNNNAYKFNPNTKSFELVETKTLVIGDLIQVRKGEKFPIDGIIKNNVTEVDESLLTGEVLPVVKKIGDKVISGSINLGSPVQLTVSSTYDNSFIQKIVQNVKNMDESKVAVARMVDKVSKWFTPVILLCGVLAFLLQVYVPNILDISSATGLFGNVHLAGLNEPWQRGLYFFIATISISCPCALGIAAPLAVLVGVGKGAKNGIIFNNAEAFEKIKKINAIAFDKTGTLTEGKLKVSNVYGNKENLSIIFRMEEVSLHPLAKSFIEYCNENKIKPSDRKLELLEKAGLGIIEEKNKFIVCSLQHALDNKFSFAKDLEKVLQQIETEKQKSFLVRTIVIFAKAKKVENIIVFEDQIRSDAKKCIQAFKKENIEVYMITGDNFDNAKVVANELGIDNFYAQVKPDEKASIIKGIQDQKKSVAYVGDGINDLIALQQSDLSFSMSADNDAAKSISDVTLVDLNIANIYKSIYLTKQTRYGIISNLIWAFAYNIVTVPLAILGFIPAIIGVYIMAISDITVNLNSWALKSMKIKTVK